MPEYVLVCVLRYGLHLVQDGDTFTVSQDGLRLFKGSREAVTYWIQGFAVARELGWN